MENPVTDEETALGEQTKSFGDLLSSDKITGTGFGRHDHVISLPRIIMFSENIIIINYADWIVLNRVRIAEISGGN